MGVGGRLKRRILYTDSVAVVWQKLTQHCKEIILQLKNKLKKREKKSLLPGI